MRTRTLAALAVTLAAGPSYAGFDTTAKVGSAMDSDGNDWACVVQDSTHVRCKVSSEATWCPITKQLPPGYVLASPGGGIFLVQNFTVRMVKANPTYGMAFATVLDTAAGGCGVSGCYQIMRFFLTLPENDESCMYAIDVTPAQYMSNYVSPDLGPTLALAEDSANPPNEYVFAVVPSSDANASGAVMGVKIPTQGTDDLTNWTWQYASGTLGIWGTHRVDPGSPIAASRSSLTGDPLVLVRDNNGVARPVMTAIFQDENGAWQRKQGTLLGNGESVGGGLAVSTTPVPTGATRWGDSLLAVSTIGNLWEDKLECANNAGKCTPNPISLGGPKPMHNNGSALDSGDSLAASWYTDSTGKPHAVAYTRTDNTHADTAQTYYLTSSFTWSAMIPGSSGWSTGDLYKGVQSNVFDSMNSKDRVYGACTDTTGNYYLCHMQRTQGATTFDWTLFGY